MFPSRIYLVGMPLCGKTRVGGWLAQRVGYGLVDLDARVCQREGRSIPEIFTAHGEQGFRRLESLALTETLRQDRVVIATGGGIVERDSNRGLLRRETTVYLQTPLGELVARGQALLAGGNDQDLGRPLLMGEDWPQRLAALYERRAPLYEQCAGVMVSAQADVETVAEQVFENLKTG